MQPRTYRRTAPDAATAHMDDDAGLGAELAAVVAGARRRTVRDGDRQTDTAHLLHSLLEHDPEVRAAVGGPAQLTRLLGYLVQRSIGYGLRWQTSVEASGEPALVPDLVPAPGTPATSGTPVGVSAGPSAPPAAPAARRGDGRGGGDPRDRQDRPDRRDRPDPRDRQDRRDGGGWSPVAAAALVEARERARRRGASGVTGTDLLAALLTDPQSRAVEVFRRAGVPAHDLPARLEAGAGEYAGDGATC
ncbi:Clp protease N-terminal domain-containing protein [Streptomyces sp. NPDC048514]|uniref:Clp protease N-terminal domain-containing protein n=1 Tax=Streptomyces sp. NPDC048514 TaxID=3365564 RepID=UPI00371DE5C3